MVTGFQYSNAAGHVAYIRSFRYRYHPRTSTARVDKTREYATVDVDIINQIGAGLFSTQIKLLHVVVEAVESAKKAGITNGNFIISLFITMGRPNHRKLEWKSLRLIFILVLCVGGCQERELMCLFSSVMMTRDENNSINAPGVYFCSASYRVRDLEGIFTHFPVSCVYYYVEGFRIQLSEWLSAIQHLPTVDDILVARVDHSG